MNETNGKLSEVCVCVCVFFLVDHILSSHNASTNPYQISSRLASRGRETSVKKSYPAICHSPSQVRLEEFVLFMCVQFGILQEGRQANEQQFLSPSKKI